MILIAGLGNPGKNYQNTRHNIGFQVIDEISRNPKILSVSRKHLNLKPSQKFKAEIVKSHLKNQKFILAKPSTFMNLAGQSIKKMRDFYKIKSPKIWLILDDFDLPLGVVRIRKKGTSGGHKGLQSVIDELGIGDFIRIRIGISPLKGRPRRSEKITYLDKFVLAEFTKSEQKIITKTIKNLAGIIIESLKRGQIFSHTYKF